MQLRNEEPGVKGIGQIEIPKEDHIVDLIGHALVQQMAGYLEALNGRKIR